MFIVTEYAALTMDKIYFILNEELRILQHSILWHRVTCITTMENGIHHIRMHYTHSLTDHSSMYWQNVF